MDQKLFSLKKIFWVSCALGLFACSKGNESTSNTNASSDVVAQTNSASNILRVDINTEPPTLDPLIMGDAVSARVIYDLFTGLVDFDQLVFMPDWQWVGFWWPMGRAIAGEIKMRDSKKIQQNW